MRVECDGCCCARTDSKRQSARQEPSKVNDRERCAATAYASTAMVLRYRSRGQRVEGLTPTKNTHTHTMLLRVRRAEKYVNSVAQKICEQVQLQLNAPADTPAQSSSAMAPQPSGPPALCSGASVKMYSLSLKILSNRHAAAAVHERHEWVCPAATKRRRPAVLSPKRPAMSYEDTPCAATDTLPHHKMHTAQLPSSPVAFF